jgi:Schlafen, AlbA_2
MSLRRRDWPLTDEQLRGVIALGETALVEFKREWWTQNNGAAKAKIARAVMALANSVGPDELALLVVGVDDERHGGGFVPITDAPIPEAVVQVLSGFIHPPPRIDCRRFILPEGEVSAIAVFHTPTRPHLCIREYSEVLSTKDVYVRRGNQVGTLTVPELERMIREKDASLGPLEERGPVEFGIVAKDDTSVKQLTFRLQSVLTEPVTQVDVVVDVHVMRDRSICARVRKLTGATLQPGEVIELVISATEIEHSLYKVFWVGEPPKRELVNYHDLTFVGDRWWDVDARVTYRNRDGFLRSQSATAVVDW